MALSKKKSTASKIKKVTVKKRPVKVSSTRKASRIETKKVLKKTESKTIKAPKKTKIAVRVLGKSSKTVKEKPVVVEELKEDTSTDSLRQDSGQAAQVEKDKSHLVAHKKEEKKSHPEKKKSKSISLYRRISFSFILLTIILIVVIFYFSFVSLTIYVTPKSERISDKLIVNVYNEEKDGMDFSSREYIKGIVEQISVKEEKKYEATGAEVIGEQVFGKVKIINNYNQSQALIASTRLLSPDGKLFRLKDNIKVPAGSEVEVEIYVDEPTQEMAIDPTEFTIPGLWAGLQDKIYAKSDEAFIFRTETKKYIQQSDLDNGIADLKSVLMSQVTEKFGQGYKGYDKVIYEIDKNSIQTEIDSKIGEEKEEFTISINALVSIIGLNSKEIEKLANEKLVSVIPNNKELLDFDSEKVEYKLGNHNFEVGVATVESIFAGTMTLKETDDIINKEKIISLSEAQLLDYLNNLNKFEDFEIIFSPSFIKKVPSLVDKIKVKVKKR